jgi:hypothetical protein
MDTGSDSEADSEDQLGKKKMTQRSGNLPRLDCAPKVSSQAICILWEYHKLLSGRQDCFASYL